jgi:hypothetical protein
VSDSRGNINAEHYLGGDGERLEGKRDEDINTKTERISDLYKTAHCASCRLGRLYTKTKTKLNSVA